MQERSCRGHYNFNHRTVKVYWVGRDIIEYSIMNLFSNEYSGGFLMTVYRADKGTGCQARVEYLNHTESSGILLTSRSLSI